MAGTWAALAATAAAIPSPSLPSPSPAVPVATAFQEPEPTSAADPTATTRPQLAPKIQIKTIAAIATDSLTDVVLDANAFIGEGLALSAFGAATRYWTTAGVLEELRDKRVRHLVEAFPYKLETRLPSHAARERVRSFATKTGDLGVISHVDLDVLALTLMIERERHGDVHLRESPVPIEIPPEGAVQSKRPKRAPRKSKTSASESAERSQKDSTVATEGKGGDSDHAQEEQEADESDAEDFEEGDDSASCDEEWITPENVKEFDDSGERVDGEPEPLNAQATPAAPCAAPADAATTATTANAQAFTLQTTSDVACVSSDFAMQNVLLQMGLRALAVTGKSIRRLQRRLLRCFGCHWVTPDTSCQFCGQCGGHTLTSLWVTLERDGSIKARQHMRPVYSLRGTQYAIPAKKGGRVCTDLILTEDEWMAQRIKERNKWKSKARKLRETNDPFIDSRQADGLPGLKVGHPRRNPNENRPGGRKNKRNRRRK